MTNQRVWFVCTNLASKLVLKGQTFIVKDALIIPRNRIQSVSSENSMLNKKIFLKTDNGTLHTLERGLQSIKKILEVLL
ncbi:hypothetical protein BKI52_09690 [marine bacterium AO1-C]|nr:hypothetical protein BKI52_09690 [marine bacterium AO1-C]